MVHELEPKLIITIMHGQQHIKVYTEFTNVVAVRRLETQALCVRWAIRKMYDARRAGMASQYYTFHRTGLNLDMASGYTEKYQN